MAIERLQDGEYYRRIARPYSSNPDDSPGWNPEDEEKADRYEKTKIIAESAGHLHHLKEHLEEICRVIYACPDNSAAFGHEIRNVLIVACTEVEAQWHGVLKANGYFGGKNEDRSSTSDYVLLLEPLRLEKYSVRFPFFPTMKEIEPFKDWKPEEPTKSLKWYDAYNKVKHDRETHFKEAKLEHAFMAAAAYFVMLCAQHGWEIAARDKLAAQKFFRLKNRPVWEKQYCYKPKGKELVFDKCKNYFSPAIEDRPPLMVRKAQTSRISQLAVP
jgi:hypothetical protein